MITGKIVRPTIQGKIEHNTIHGHFPGSSSLSVSAISAFLNSLPEYTTDEAAVADGLVLHSLYWVAEGSDTNIPGNLRRVTTD
jgi:hypothetical protein